MKHHLTRVEEGPGPLVTVHFKRANGSCNTITASSQAAALQLFRSRNPGEVVIDQAGQQAPAPAAAQEFRAVDLLNFKRSIPEWAYVSGLSTRWMAFVDPQEAFVS